MDDNPAEYVTRLETDLRAARAALTRAERERDQAKIDLEASDALRDGLRLAAVDAAGVASAALGRAIRDEPVIRAAYAMCAAVARKAPSDEGARLGAELFQAVIDHQKSGPS